MDDAPKKEYFGTFFSVELPPDGLPRTFGIVTAFNARGQLLSEEVNRKADIELKRYLADTRLKHFRVTGGSRDGSHQEPGFGIAAQSPEDIRIINRHFLQAAFFWVEDGVAFVTNTEDKTLHRVDDWAARQTRWELRT